MNDKQRNRTDESKLALQTARVLESGECTDQEDAATYELGRLLRQSATHDLPESNDDLREQLLATLSASGDAPLVSVKAPLGTTPARTISRRWWIGLAAGALVAAGGLLFYQPYFEGGTLGRQSALNSLNFDNADSAAPFPKTTPDLTRPAVIYQTETVTEEMPVQKLRTETKTRQLPVQRMRKETRQIKLADGSWETKEVKVPYTENVTQNYSVQVPYTENKKRTFEKKVPYTADGKKITAADYGKFGDGCLQVENCQGRSWPKCFSTRSTLGASESSQRLEQLVQFWQCKTVHWTCCRWRSRHE